MTQRAPLQHAAAGHRAQLSALVPLAVQLERDRRDALAAVLLSALIAYETCRSAELRDRMRRHLAHP